MPKSRRVRGDRWVAGGPLPEGLPLGDECDLRDPIDHGGRVRVSSMELQSYEIEQHLQTGNSTSIRRPCIWPSARAGVAA
jgi:DNA recombination-dependent growth factor C